jgi:hypothetical protein
MAGYLMVILNFGLAFNSNNPQASFTLKPSLNSLSQSRGLNFDITEYGFRCSAQALSNS